MAATIQVLGQLAPSAAAETALFTCSTTSVVISSLFICNTSGTADTFTVRISVGGAGDAAKQLLYSTAPLPGYTTLAVVAGITMANTDVMKVTSTNGTTVFSLFGQENS
jgi:hypothetical protein